MISAEVLAFFNVEDEEDLDDAFEQLFFEHKQFFLSKVPVRKLVEARIAKLEKAYQMYAGSSLKADVVIDIESHSFESHNLLDLFQEFQRAKTCFYLKFQQTNTVENFVQLLWKYCDLYYAYASKFSGTFDSDSTIRVSVESDPMMLLNAIKEYEAKGGKTLNDLKNFENDPPELLVHEMKRLSLLFNSF
jgi:hypothetical protein